MERRRRFYRPGLLRAGQITQRGIKMKIKQKAKTCLPAFFLLIFQPVLSLLICVPPLYAQEVISLTVNPDVLTPGVPFTLTLLINYPAPEDVSITAPVLPPQLVMERMIKYPLSSGTFPVHIYTIVEYRFTANASGIFTLESFIITTPAGSAGTGVYSLLIRNPASAQRQQFITTSLYWEVSQTSAVRAGDRVTLTLRANSRNALAASFFMPETPQGVILSAQPVTAEETQSGIVLKLLLIPLAAGTFTLPARVLEYENTHFQIPALSISVINR